VPIVHLAELCAECGDRGWGVSSFGTAQKPSVGRTTRSVYAPQRVGGSQFVVRVKLY